MRFSQFMEQYRKSLTDASTLDELLEEAKRNHRVQKLLPVYILKDTETFNNMLELASKDPFAKKLVAHARITVKTFEKDNNTNSLGMKRLLTDFDRVSRMSSQNSNVSMEDWELEGYSKVLNSYFVRNRVFTPLKSMRRRKKMSSVDWENLVETHR